MCLISAITTMKSHADSVTEAIANHILGMLLVYVAILNLVNALRRNPPNDQAQAQPPTATPGRKGDNQI